MTQQTETTHAPTPWTIDDHRVLDIRDSNGESVARVWRSSPRETNAELIVRAVNSHQALLDALEALLDASQIGDAFLRDTDSVSLKVADFKQARAALARAKGETL